MVLSDGDRIRNLLGAYCELVDAGDHVGVGALFGDDGVLAADDGTVIARGQAAIADFYARTTKRHDGSPRTKHLVTNTVLVSVTQRTREIGVRRAVGAPRARIVQEVVTESVLLSLIGGATGAVAAWMLLTVVASATGLPLEVKAATVGWALAAAAASGLAAAWYPARRATALDVVGALRAE